jgi:hypothetical protein
MSRPGTRPQKVWACEEFSGSPGIEIQRLFVRTISTQGRNNDAARRWLAYYGPLQSDSRTPYQLPSIGVETGRIRVLMSAHGGPADMPCNCRSGLSGASGISSNLIRCAWPSGSFSSISRAAAWSVTFRINATPLRP